MTVADFLNALKTKATVSIIRGGEVILEVKSGTGVADRLATDVSSAGIATIELVGSTAICVTIEPAP